MPTEEKLLRTKEGIVEKGQEILCHRIEPLLGASEKGKFIAVDVVTEAYEIDRNCSAAFSRLLARCPSASIYLGRVGEPAAFRMRNRFKIIYHDDRESAGSLSLTAN